jgi:hypothetical protein
MTDSETEPNPPGPGPSQQHADQLQVLSDGDEEYSLSSDGGIGDYVTQIRPSQKMGNALEVKSYVYSGRPCRCTCVAVCLCACVSQTESLPVYPSLPVSQHVYSPSPLPPRVSPSYSVSLQTYLKFHRHVQLEMLQKVHGDQAMVMLVDIAMMEREVAVAVLDLWTCMVCQKMLVFD